MDWRAGPGQSAEHHTSGLFQVTAVCASCGNTWSCGLGLPCGLELDYSIAFSFLSEFILSMQTVISLRNWKAAAAISIEGMLYLAQDENYHTSYTSAFVNQGLPHSTFLLYLSWLMWCALRLPASHVALTYCGSWNRDKMKLMGNKLWMFHLCAWVYVYSSEI